MAPGNVVKLKTPTRERTLEERAQSINDLWWKLNGDKLTVYSRRLAIGKELIEARALVPHGEWEAWCKANFINRSMRDIRRVMKLAGADDPEAALAEDRTAAREGMAATRANRTNVSPVESAPSTPADPVDRVFSAFLRLDADQRARLLARIEATEK
jgi:Protein of unknown function (DUF3102)